MSHPTPGDPRMVPGPALPEDDGMATTPFPMLDVAGREVRVSNPDKIYFPAVGITKLELVEYYLSVREGILRALQDRPTTLERWPGGVFEGAKRATRTDPRG